MSRRTAASALLVGGVLVLATASAQAAPGALDPSFGTGGKVTTTIGTGNDEAHAVALQPDGKIVAAGYSYNGSNYDFGLARYNADGSLDPSFGTGGKVTTAIGSGSDYAYALALQPNGKIVACGYSFIGSKWDFALARYNADGTPDPGFGSGGKVTTAIGASTDEAYALALQPDGKLVAAGLGLNGVTTDFALARYNPDGTPDPSFGSGGKVTTSISSGLDDAYALALQPDGKLVAAGDSSGNFALARYNANGTLDTSFGTGGEVTTPIFGSDVVDALALQPDGKLVAAGSSYNGVKDDFALVRYNPDGTLDTSFGTGGKVVTPIDSGDFAFGLALQPDGRLVAAGLSYNGSKDDFALVRYNADGSLDPSFGTGGKVTTAIGSGSDDAFALALQPDGKLVTAGRSSNGTNNDFALVRYLGSTLTVTKAGSGSGTVTTSPVGIDCGATCSGPFAAVPVTLTATAAAGSTFTDWSGDCSGTGTCNLTMSADHSAIATFESDKTLTVTKAGSGTGTVSSAPAGIACGSTCSHAFVHGTSVTLTTAAASRSTFAGWSGACSGTGACTLSMSADHTATAKFTPRCVVPKVKGKKLKAAKAAIKRAHCAVGKIRKAYSSKVRKGRVISQKPAPGKKLPAGSKVKLKVSRGPR